MKLNLEMEDVKITIKTGSDTETTIVQQAPVAMHKYHKLAPVAAAQLQAEAPAPAATSCR